MAVYKSHDEAEAAIQELRKSGFDLDKISIIGREYLTEEHVVGYYNAASVTAAAGAGATIAETDGAQVNEIFALASDAVDAAELEADEVGAVAENDSIAAINQATQVINNLKNTVVAIGRIFSDTGGNDQDAAAELGFGKITMDRGLWSPAMNNMIMQALIKNGNTFYISSRLSMNNMLVNGRLTVTAVELRQLLDAGYTQSGFDMYPPQ